MCDHAAGVTDVLSNVGYLADFQMSKEWLVGSAMTEDLLCNSMSQYFGFTC